MHNSVCRGQYFSSPSQVRDRFTASLAVAGLAVATVLALVLPLSPAQAFTSGAKRSKVTEIIVHATGGPSCKGRKVAFSNPGTLKLMARFFKRSRRVSIHYIVGRDGRISKGIPENRVAIHTRGHNRQSIGIEMINRGDGSEYFPPAQFDAMVKLVRGIARRHNIKPQNILRHSDVDHSTFRCAGKRIRRKQDPGPAFDWRAFKAALAPQPRFYAGRLLAPPRLVHRRP